MVLGIGHVANNIGERGNFIDNSCSIKGMEFEFLENNLENLDIKNTFLRHPVSEHHIKLLRPSDEKGICIEQTFHGVGNVATDRINVEGSVIKIDTQKISEDSRFFGVLGFEKAQDNTFYLNSFFKHKSGQILLKKSERDCEEIYLDDLGYTCIALIVKKMDKVIERVEQYAGKVSDVSSLVVNGQELKICLIKSPSGINIELVERVRKKL